MSEPNTLHERFADFEALAPEGSFYGGASEAEIQEAEQYLGVKFPHSYRSFLQLFGAATWPDYIYGLGSAIPQFLCVTFKTTSERNDVEPQLTPQLVPFSSDGAGNLYCLDTSRVDGDECPVTFWRHDCVNPGAEEWCNASFIDWLEEFASEVHNT